MTYVINIQHWLDEDGAPARPVRKQALRVARLIEYGGPLELGHARATLVECSRRVNRRACEGRQGRRADGRGRREHLLISGWEDTEWAHGPMDPLPPNDGARPLFN